MVNAIILSLFAGMASAATVANMANPPKGNPIFTPETGSTVVAGEPFEITWNATTEGTVTIWYCKGPGSNCVNGETPIADEVPNTGSFTWNVATTLEPSEEVDAGYGVQIVSDQDNTFYQFTGQFGIANADYDDDSKPTGKPTGKPTHTDDYPASTSGYESSEPTYYPTATGGANSTIVYPTKSMSVPSSLKTTVYTTATEGGDEPTSASTGVVVQTTNAAPIAQIGLGAIFGGVVAAFAL